MLVTLHKSRSKIEMKKPSIDLPTWKISIEYFAEITIKFKIIYTYTEAHTHM